MATTGARVAWDGEWSEGYRARVLVVEDKHGCRSLALESYCEDALGNPSWRPWPQPLPVMPCALVDAVDQLAELVRHAWVHGGYQDCGRQQMTTAQKLLFDAVTGRVER